MARRIRIVVGEGRTAQRGLLRFVLEGEGFDVAGEARGTADLSGVIEATEPDVVVLDDGIGVMAVSMVHEVAPRAKVVLVWPSAVVPIGGDARVEPAKILRDLGPAVQHVMAPAAALTETFERPAWIDKVRKDPAALREKLGNGNEKTKRPSVTHLQRRSKRLHPTGTGSGTAEGRPREEDSPAPLVVLPVGTGGSDLEPILDIGGATPDSEPSEEPIDEPSEWNRRLGTLALSGAAAVSALVLALALGGGRLSVSLVRGGGRIPIVAGFAQPGVVGQGPFGSGSLGGSGWDPTVIDEPDGSDLGPGAGGDGGSGFTVDLASPGDSEGGSDEPAPGEEPIGDDGTGGGDDGTGGGDDGTGGGDDGTGGGGVSVSGLPGMSAVYNPHGGPPGKLGLTPPQGPGLGVDGGSLHSHKH